MTHREEILMLCHNLRQLRKQHGLSKKEMAAILRISARSLNMLENDILPPQQSCDFLFYASRYFNIKICDLFLPIDESSKRPSE